MLPLFVTTKNSHSSPIMTCLDTASVHFKFSHFVRLTNLMTELTTDMVFRILINGASAISAQLGIYILLIVYVC